MLNAHARTQRALVRTVELSSIILIEYTREHKARRVFPRRLGV